MRAACVVVNTRVCESGGVGPASGSGWGPRAEGRGAAALPVLPAGSAVLERAGTPSPSPAGKLSPPGQFSVREAVKLEEDFVYEHREISSGWSLEPLV